MAFIPMLQARYDIERSAYNTWLIFDSHRPKDPTVYVLILSRIQNKWYNYQVTLAQFDGSVVPEHDPKYPDYSPKKRKSGRNAKREMHEYYIFDSEIYSTQFYANSAELALEQVKEIHSILQVLDITNPYLLNSKFGGFLRNERVPTPKSPFSH